MNVIYILLPVAFLFAIGFLWAFIRSVKGGQFDDTQTPAMRILHDDDPAPPQRSASDAPSDSAAEDDSDKPADA
ncbi:MAG: cbb3-type cytochrome oxidase assembly protein CcoS [Deltaproteobacteria bacterium]|nr:cbb3-type cytochrome oxidase assembly protein CcoS [bacterium]MCB9487336.1 cbb3-type cytochrome oxidase assembly protein CcoS [Deltaproteobacteria bacterium]